MKQQKTTSLRLRCYVDPDVVLERKASQIKSAIYICHDADRDDDGNLKRKHYHVNLRLLQYRVPDEIKRWFVDTDNPNAWVDYDANTYGDAIEYYTHRNAPAKHQYDDGAVCYFKCTSADIDTADADDPCFNIVARMLNGDSLLELVRLYGKNFVYHYRSFKEIVMDINNSYPSDNQ